MPERNLIKRHLAPRVLEALQTSRIVNIVGPRQAGKSTLVKHQIAIAEYITMDSDNMRNALSIDAYAQLRSMADRHEILSNLVFWDKLGGLLFLSDSIFKIDAGKHVGKTLRDIQTAPAFLCADT